MACPEIESCLEGCLANRISDALSVIFVRGLRGQTLFTVFERNKTPIGWQSNRTGLNIDGFAVRAGASLGNITRSERRQA